MSSWGSRIMKKLLLVVLAICIIFVFGQIKYEDVRNQNTQNTPFTTQSRFLRESALLHNLFVKVSSGIVYCYSGSSKTTGFFVSRDGWIITAGHKVDRDFPKANVIYVIFNRRNKSEVLTSEVVVIAKGLDLLGFKVDYQPKFYFKDFRDPHLFEECWIFGFRGVADLVPSGPGYVTYNTSRTAMLYCTARIYFGNSGSPVINRKGEVLGVAVEGYKNWDTNFIPGSLVKAFIDSLRSDKK